jgi:hypothetical protein
MAAIIETIITIWCPKEFAEIAINTALKTYITLKVTFNIFNSMEKT